VGDDSKIQWTDATWSNGLVERERVKKPFVKSDVADGVEKRIDVAISFSAVAGAACRHNVRSERTASFRNRLEVVPGRGPIAAVRALAVELLHQLALRLGVDRIAASLSRMRVLPSFCAHRGIAGVARTLLRGGMQTTRAASDFGGIEPLATASAPSARARSVIPALENRRAVRGASAPARAADVAATVRTCLVRLKMLGGKRLSALHAGQCSAKPKLFFHGFGA